MKIKVINRKKERKKESEKWNGPKRKKNQKEQSNKEKKRELEKKEKKKRKILKKERKKEQVVVTIFVKISMQTICFCKLQHYIESRCNVASSRQDNHTSEKYFVYKSLIVISFLFWRVFYNLYYRSYKRRACTHTHTHTHTHIHLSLSLSRSLSLSLSGTYTDIHAHIYSFCGCSLND